MKSSFKTHMEWKIQIPLNNLSPVTSPEFFILDSEWRLEMRLNSESPELYYCIYICRLNNGKNLPTEHLERSFGVTTFLKRHNYELSNRLYYSVDCPEKIIARYSATTLKKLNITKTFEVLCLFEEPVTDVIHKPDFSLTMGIQGDFDVSFDLDSLLKIEAPPSDIFGKWGDCSNHAHKSMLEAESEVFEAMFRSKRVESETGVVEIPDMDWADFELFLKFVYSGKIQFPSEDSAICLYAASDKYALLPLKKECSDYMIRNLNLKNCLLFLEMSERHGDVAFMGAALKFVAENLDGLNREEWSSFSAKSPKLAVKVYEKRFKGTLSKQILSKI